jgi:hypothetical protein
MATTYDKIATTTLSSSAATIAFSSIAATYTDLRVVIVPIATGGADYVCYMRFNSDSATNYSGTKLQGYGSAVSNRYTSNTALYLSGAYGFKTTPSMFTIDTFSYAGSTYKTSLVTESADYNGSGEVAVQVGLWLSTSAITSITFSTDAGNNFATGTTATLYGIKAA